MYIYICIYIIYIQFIKEVTIKTYALHKNPEGPFHIYMYIYIYIYVCVCVGNICFYTFIFVITYFLVSPYEKSIKHFDFRL